jgi:hypothetical protein
MTTRTFKTWLNTFVSEKGLDLEHVFTVTGQTVFGDNFIPLSIVLDAIKKAPLHEQSGIKNMLVRIDFANADPLKYFGHLAQALAI